MGLWKYPAHHPQCDLYGRLVYNKSHNNNYLDQRRIINQDEDTYIIGEKKFEAIIDEDKWYKANAMRRSKKKSTLVVGGTVLRSRCNPSTNMWTNKLICSCGSGFIRDLWGKNKAGVPSWGYRCYNKLNHGSAKVRREAGLDTTDFCEMKMLPQWRLDLIAEHIFEDTFVNKRDVFAKALELVKKNIAPTMQHPHCVSRYGFKLSRLGLLQEFGHFYKCYCNYEQTMV